MNVTCLFGLMQEAGFVSKVCHGYGGWQTNPEVVINVACNVEQWTWWLASARHQTLDQSLILFLSTLYITLILSQK